MPSLPPTTLLYNTTIIIIDTYLVLSSAPPHGELGLYTAPGARVDP